MVPDETIFQQLKAREPAAYEWLVVQFEAPLFRFFLCDHRDYHLAQEQTSETFVEIIRSLPRMQGTESQLRPFVFSIARHLKSRHWRKPVVVCSPIENALDIRDPAPAPEAIASNREQTQQMLNAIARFEPHVREILLLRFVEETSLDDITEIVGLPLGTVKSHIHRGIARLKSILTGKEDEN